MKACQPIYTAVLLLLIRPQCLLPTVYVYVHVSYNILGYESYHRDEVHNYIHKPLCNHSGMYVAIGTHAYLLDSFQILVRMCRYGKMPKNVVEYRRDCTGSESNLLHCNEGGDHTCRHSAAEHYIGIACNGVSYLNNHSRMKEQREGEEKRNNAHTLNLDIYPLWTCF